MYAAIGRPMALQALGLAIALVSLHDLVYCI
jgi:hypothetical protein